MVEELRVEFISLALDTIPVLTLDASATFRELFTAISDARPSWNIGSGTDISDVWDLLSKERGRSRTGAKRKRQRRESRRPLPENIPQLTCKEVLNASRAIADAAQLDRWHVIPGETALRHRIDGETLEVKLTVGDLLARSSNPTDYDSLRDELRELCPEGVLLYLLALGLVLQERHVTVEIDDLIRLLGWQPRSTAERLKQRARVFHWLTLFDSLIVIGERKGDYFDLDTKKRLDLTCRSALLKVIEVICAEGQEEFAGDSTPILVTLTAGPFLDRLRDDRHVLQDLGNLRKLAGLPTGKPSGAWALSIGLALNQLWREMASRAKVVSAGDNNRPTARFDRPFTRVKLLKMFRAQLWVGDVLNSANPHRAQLYWDEAISLLKRHGFISYYKELDDLPENRLGRKDFWLNAQRLDIRPGIETTKQIRDIANSTKKVNRAQSRKRGARKRGSVPPNEPM